MWDVAVRTGDTKKPQGESCKGYFLAPSARAAAAHPRWPASRVQVRLLQLLAARPKRKEKKTNCDR